jgi:hypothetical protein
LLRCFSHLESSSGSNAIWMFIVILEAMESSLSSKDRNGRATVCLHTVKSASGSIKASVDLKVFTRYTVVKEYGCG